MEIHPQRMVLIVVAAAILNAFSGAASAQPVTYGYDSLSRLTQVTYPDGTSVTYTYDAAGNRLSEVVDVAAPSVVIEVPTATGVYTTNTTPLDLSGSAADDIGVAEVTWSNDRGGSGAAVGTTSWAVALIPLQPGVNVLTVTATDAVGKTAFVTLMVTLEFSTPTDTPTQEPTQTPVASDTPVASVTPTQTAMSTPTSSSPIATLTSTQTPASSATSTTTSTPTHTPTPSTPTPTATASAATVIRFGDALGLAYNPTEVSISIGDTVEWQGDFASHPLVSDDALWPMRSTGTTFAFTFTAPGTYGFHCHLHGAPNGIGMAGKVIVSPANTPIPSPTPSPTASVIATPTETATHTVTPTTLTPASTSTPSTTSTPAETPASTLTPTPMPTLTATPEDTATGTPATTPTETIAATPTDTPADTPTDTPQPTPSHSPTDTRTPAPADTATVSPTPTFTRGPIVYPQASASPNPARPGDRVTLDGSGSAGPILSYAWTQVAGPAVALDGAGTVRATFVAPPVEVPTTLIFELSVHGSPGGPCDLADAMTLIGMTVSPLSCTGDCNDDGEVAVSELITMVNISLGNAQMSACRAGDMNGDGEITVNEIIAAVNNALGTCSRPMRGAARMSGDAVSLDAPVDPWRARMRRATVRL